jgi:hypothetical protein
MLEPEIAFPSADLMQIYGHVDLIYMSILVSQRMGILCSKLFCKEGEGAGVAGCSRK